MEKENLARQIIACAELFYQNREQEAYDNINHLLPQINQMMQEVVVYLQNTAGSEEDVGYMLQVMRELVDAFQVKDNLALADLLYYNISEIAAI